mmetsp:Transcript_70322/g.139409  ORF Transcript_70322/g.139409 Transcript_70322/m.139409 type:complete len:202 (+) Transcript_70322:1115-1720(+)
MLPEQPQGRSSSPSDLSPRQMRHSSGSSCESGGVAASSCFCTDSASSCSPADDKRKARRAFAIARYLARTGRGTPCNMSPSGTDAAALRHLVSKLSAVSKMRANASTANEGGSPTAAGVPETMLSSNVHPGCPAAALACSAMPNTAARIVSWRMKLLYSSESGINITPGSFSAGISFIKACSCNNTTRSVNVGCQLGPGHV